MFNIVFNCWWPDFSRQPKGAFKAAYLSLVANKFQNLDKVFRAERNLYIASSFITPAYAEGTNIFDAHLSAM